MEDKDIRRILEAHQLQCHKITKAVGSFDKELFFIDDRYLIRTSGLPMLEEQTKINRIRNMKYVPKIIHASDQNNSNNVFYLVLEYIQGCELLSAYNDLSDQSRYDIGFEIADFLLELHKIKGQYYDIGHYVPIIPSYDKSWRSGHEQYWDYIYKGLTDIQLPSEGKELLELSSKYINTNISSLDFENGPALLHNDFHYKNIIIINNAFSGVIDWECSQYGEPDFDLIHLLHWCIFPPSKDLDMKILCNTVLQQYLKNCRIPKIEQRLTIYLLEHDFIQILWSKGKRADEFLSRISCWVNKGVENYIQNLRI